MGKETGITWTDHTFNAWWGCTKVDPACDNCYAATFDKRVGGSNWGPDAPRRFFGAAHWKDPIKWNAAAMKAGVRRRVFCSSMADVFETRRDAIGVQMSAERLRLWALIRDTPWLDWQLLTKRANLILDMLPADWGDGYPNVWLGVTVGNTKGLRRARCLVGIPAVVHFVSYEPALEYVDFSAHLRLGYGVQWLIAGAESGPHARPMNEEWARSARDQCAAAGTVFFLKQFADERGRKISLPMIDGRQWSEFPR